MGYNFGCANSGADNLIRCWGLNSSGQLGNLDAGDSVQPIIVMNGPQAEGFNGISTAASLALYHACGIDAQGVVWCWGSAAAGQLGLAVSVASGATSYAVQVLSGMAKVASGMFSSCAIDPAGRIRCWGGNANGELGHDPSTDPISACHDNGGPCNPNPTFVRAADGSDFDHATAVSVGGAGACALRDDHTVWCWGNGFGRIGSDAGPDAGVTFTPMQVAGLP